MSWIPLHVHSQYSILTGMASIADLVRIAKSFSIEALSLTDFANLFGAVDFFRTCQKEGIRPILGCEIVVAPRSRFEKKKIPGEPIGGRFVLLAKNQTGYRNLCKIVSSGYLEGFYYTPRVDREILETFCEGLICLSGPIQGKIPQLILSSREEALLEELSWCQKVYQENFYFSLQRHEMSAEAIEKDRIEQESWLYHHYLDFVNQQKKVEEKLLSLSKEKGIDYVATNAVYYLHREDWQAHEVLLNIQSGQPCELIKRDRFGAVKERFPNPKRRVLPSHEFYFKSQEEMSTLFADLPHAIEMSSVIADQCHVELDFATKYYPVFVPPSLEGKAVSEEEREQEVGKYLRSLCEQNIPHRYTQEKLECVREKYPGREPLEVVKERLESELNIILSKGLSDYLLIVHDFIYWAKSRGIPVGPGRGSGVGSIILYLIGIIDIEPLRFSLFFERFINPERISYPDIDVDICMERRFEVIDYTVQKYGKDKVAQIITFGTMKAKMAIRDVGRVLDVPLAKVNEMVKLIPDDPGMTIDKAFEIEASLKELAENDQEMQKVFLYAKKLEGSIRNTGIHAAGLIISGNPLTDHIPVCTVKDSELAVTQYSMKPVEAVGMLKIDFLGLKTLTCIQKTIDAVEKNHGEKINLSSLSLKDQKTFDLLNQGKTSGVFQVESAGMRELVKELQVERFETIIAVVALYRPGPMEMIPAFIERKHGHTPVEIDHPLLEDIIGETYGIMVYQEQVMQAASVLANYSLAEGDVLRRAMGKKDRSEMAKQRKKFRQGALANGISAEISMKIFDKMEKFASYGFNKSHATAYGYLCYVTAYFKANYPREWMAALMTCDRDDISKLSKHIRECEATSIPILPPHVNEAGIAFVATTQGIRFAMSGIKGVGLHVVEAILQERKGKGPFSSLADFIRRVCVTKVTRKAIENLIEAGSFDFTKLDRQVLLTSVEPLFKRANRQHKEKEKGVLDLFANQEEEEHFPLLEKNIEPLLKREVLAKEKELLGFYLTDHPMNEYRDLCNKLQCEPFDRLHALSHETPCRIAFIIEQAKVRVSAKTQRKFAILSISDGVEHFELPIWAHLYEEDKQLFVEGNILYAMVQIDKSGEGVKLRCHRAVDLTKIEEEDIQSCEESYQQWIQTLHKNQKQLRKMEKKEEEKKTLYLACNVVDVRFSHIVQLKKIIQKFSGLSPVAIEFYEEHAKVATITVEEQWGIEWNSAFEDELKQLSFLGSYRY